MSPFRFIIPALVLVRSAPAQPADPWDRVPPLAESLLHESFAFDDRGQSGLQLGGHARSMVELYRNRDFGFARVPDDSWVHHRIQACAVWEQEQRLRLLAELTWGEMQGMSGDLAPPDEDHLDLLQLYAQARFEIDSATELLVRAGRQVLYYGSGRLLAHREGANQRLVHDALRLSWRHGEWSMDGLVASPVRIGPGAFDNESHFDQTLLWGIYAAGPSLFGAGHRVELYYLGLDRESSPLVEGQQEQRHTFGTRWSGKAGPWSYNDELMVQTGEIADRQIFAGALSLSGSYMFNSALLKPVLGLRADLISGGQSGDQVHTFDPLFQANNYFNEGGFLSPANLYNLNPRLSLDLGHQLSLDLGVNFLWRFDTEDAVYAPPFNAVTTGAPGGERYLGTAYNLAFTWDPHPSFNLSMGFTHHEAGPSLTSTGGRSVDYLQVAVRIEF